MKTGEKKFICARLNGAELLAREIDAAHESTIIWLFYIQRRSPVISSFDKIQYQGGVDFDDTVYLTDMFKNQCIEIIKGFDDKFGFNAGGSPCGLDDKPQGFYFF